MLKKYTPFTSVWEITMGCNMRCKHCGSSCEDALKGELSTKEALKLCDELADLGLNRITISGGEPTTRKDWDLIVKRLADHKILVGLITNGWLFTEETAIRAKSAGVNTIAFSLDGLKHTHDNTRKEGAFDRVMNGIDCCRENKIPCSIVTTINSDNIPQLDEMYEILVQKKVFAWQIQTALLMGNMEKHSHLMGSPKDIDEIIDFAYSKIDRDEIQIHLADCIGYYNHKEIEVRNKLKKSKNYNWKGCQAGKRNIGILHNGDILGCTSIRSREFIEGNIRERSLRDIWEDSNNFNWCRNITKDKLTGFCKKCKFGDECLGGCANTRLTREGSVYGENKYCSYNLAIKEEQKKIDKVIGHKKLLKKARELVGKNSLQSAEIILNKLIKKKGYDYEIYALYGYVSFMLNNYEDAFRVNEELIKKNPDDLYANKGYGLTLAKLGKVEEGISHLKKAISLAKGEFTDAYHDLAVVYIENERYEEALEQMKKGMELSPSYKKKVENNEYKSIKKRTL